jgi:flavodoxin
MTRRKLNRKPWLTFAVVVFLMSWVYSPLFYQGLVSAETAQVAPVSPQEKPLIVYYTLTGNNKIIAEELKKQLNADIAELKTVSERSGLWGFVVSGYENIFDKDADLQPFTADLAARNPIILCSPVWMQKISSPARVFLKNPALKGKDLYLFASFKGRWGEDKEAELVKNLTGMGIVVKGVYRMVLGKKTEDEIKKEVAKQLEKKPILQKAAEAS